MLHQLHTLASRSYVMIYAQVRRLSVRALQISSSIQNQMLSCVPFSAHLSQWRSRFRPHITSAYIHLQATAMPLTITQSLRSSLDESDRLLPKITFRM